MNNTLRAFFQQKKEELKNNPQAETHNKYEWHIEYLVNYLQSPEWINEINNFIDENCILFEDIQENYQEYNNIYKKFQALLDNLLTKFAKEELTVSDEEFTKLIDIGLQDEDYECVIRQLLITEDFLLFKQVMLQRNIQIENEAMCQYLLEIRNSAEQHNLDEIELERAIALSLNIQDQFSDYSDDEDEEMQKAILESQKDFIASQKPQFQEKKTVQGKKLSTLETPITVLKQQEIDVLLGEREKLIKQLQKADESKPDQEDQKVIGHMEDKEERKKRQNLKIKRLMEQRQLIIQQKKQQREQDQDELKCQGDEKKIPKNLICEENEKKLTPEQIQKLETNKKIMQKLQNQL